MSKRLNVGERRDFVLGDLEILAMERANAIALRVCNDDRERRLALKRGHESRHHQEQNALAKHGGKYE